MNGWVYDLRSIGSIPMGDALRELYVVLPAKQSDSVPLFADCASFVGFPLETDSPPTSLITPVPTRTSDTVSQGMHGFCMARHGRAINVVFLDATPGGCRWRSCGNSSGTGSLCRRM